MRIRLAVPDEIGTDILVCDMEHPPWSWRVEVCKMPWNRAAEALRSGDIDLAFVSPQAIYALRESCEVVPGMAMTSHGGNGAALLIHRAPLEETTHVLCEGDGHAGEFLVELLFAAGGRPISLSMSDSLPDEPPGDAGILLCGDRARRHRATPGIGVLDLGAAWNDLSELPFVWGAWLARRGIVDREIYKILHSARTHGRRAVKKLIAHRFDKTYFRDKVTCLLNEHTVFRLGRAELAGLRRLWTVGLEHGLLDGSSNDESIRFVNLGRKTSCHDLAERLQSARKANRNKQ